MVIPTRDRWGLAARAAACALAQVDVQVEVLVVDDGSRDEPPPLPDGATLLRSGTSRGVAAARNAGLRAAASGWVAFLDDDDLWAPDRLARLVSAAEGAGADWACSSALIVDAEVEPLGLHPVRPAAELPAALRDGNAVPGGGSAVVSRTGTARDLGGFDEAFSFAADWDMWLRLAAAAPVVALEDPLVAYTMSAGSWVLRDSDSVRADNAAIQRKHPEVTLGRGVMDLFMAQRLFWLDQRRGASRHYLLAGLRSRDAGSLARSAGALLGRRQASRLRLATPAPPAPDWLERWRVAG